MPQEKIGGPGFYNDEELVWRGYAEWQARGYKPTKADIESIDEQWDSDLNMANALVAYMAQQNQMVGNVG